MQMYRNSDFRLGLWLLIAVVVALFLLVAAADREPVTTVEAPVESRVE